MWHATFVEFRYRQDQRKIRDSFVVQTLWLCTSPKRNGVLIVLFFCLFVLALGRGGRCLCPVLLQLRYLVFSGLYLLFKNIIHICTLSRFYHNLLKFYRSEPFNATMQVPVLQAQQNDFPLQLDKRPKWSFKHIKVHIKGDDQMIWVKALLLMKSYHDVACVIEIIY